MRQGNYPHLCLNKRGQIFAVSTGSDATSEHEMGSDLLMTEMTRSSQLLASDVANLMRLGRLKEVPQLSEVRGISGGLDGLHFETGPLSNFNPVLQAVLCFSARWSPDPDRRLLANPNVMNELRFRSYGSEPHDVAGAWSDGDFAIRVKGQRLVAQLTEFTNAIRAGSCMFAGSFLTEDRGVQLSGVIIARHDLFRPEHRQAMNEAQKKFECNVRLHLRSRADELEAVQREASFRAGYITPVWSDDVVDGDVVYALNPASSANADYRGPYSFEQLQSWIKAGGSYRLSLDSREPTSTVQAPKANSRKPR